MLIISASIMFLYPSGFAVRFRLPLIALGYGAGFVAVTGVVRAMGIIRSLFRQGH